MNHKKWELYMCDYQFIVLDSFVCSFKNVFNWLYLLKH